ncbi:MAG: aminoglycoside phosphotransferase family protein [Clostridia bacterium]|nr:aminoglycoside phosphotransferase family protein [Clostridia bacterium]
MKNDLKGTGANSALASELKDICGHFQIEGEMTGCEEIKLGHINSTYYAHYRLPDGEKKTYVVQKINMYVFKNPRLIMENIEKISSHIRRKDPSAALDFHHTGGGRNYYINKGSFWRLYTYVEGGTVDGGSRSGMLAAGKAFGRFQTDLHDFDGTALREVIPDFHNTKKRFAHLFATAAEDPCGRAGDVDGELAAAKRISGLACRISEEAEKGRFPVRPTHNDTKTNNVIVNEATGEPICVIDLDTVMPGLVLHDFGDAIRFGANRAAEDEPDLSKVGLDLDMFRAFAEGFIGETAKALTKDELDYMALGALTMTAECGARFLDDYLSGDQYFRIAYPEHNLIRARNQLRLAEDMEAHMDEMNAIVFEIYHKAIDGN